jgi:hypothetical protein
MGMVAAEAAALLQAQGIAAVNARKLLRLRWLFMGAFYPMPRYRTPEITVTA